MSSDNIGWDFIQTLEHEVGLDRDTAERIEAVIDDSKFYLHHGAMDKEREEWDQTVWERDERIADLESQLDELKDILDILDQIKALVTNA